MPPTAVIWNRFKGVALGTLSLDENGGVVPDNSVARVMTEKLYVQRVTAGEVQLGQVVSYADGDDYLPALPFAINGSYIFATYSPAE